jgi:branched-chain amino acid transport system permease protein
LKRKMKMLLHSQRFYFFLLSVAATACIPVFERDLFVIHVLTLISIFAIYSSSWNLLAYSGQASLGHAAFLGIGGFTSSLIAINLGISPWFGLLIGGAVSSGIGFLIGLACVRLREWFLAMVTFGFAVIAETVTSHFDHITHGVWGFRTPLLVPPGIPFYYAALLLAVSSISLMYLIMKSKIGLAFSAIRENESEARMIGVNTTKYKLLAFVMSTFFAGLSGALYAHFIRYINIKVYVPENSFKPLMMSVIGGLGTIEGPVIGSAIMVFIDSFLPTIDKTLQALMGPFFIEVSNVGPPIRMIGIGIFLVVIVIFIPKGVSSLLHRIYSYLRESVKS